MILLIVARRPKNRRYEQCQCGCGEHFLHRHMVDMPSPFPGTRPDRIYVRHAIESGYAVIDRSKS